jgi:CRP/FNR family transcriptional activator FtrB
MRESDLERLKDLALFSGLPPDAFRRLTSAALLQRFPAEVQLLFEGDRVDFLYVLLDGAVELQAAWKDKETTLAVLWPVSSFILESAVLDSPALMSVRTLARSEIAMLPAEALRAAMREDPGFSLRVAEELAGCCRGVVRVLKGQKLRGGAARLANYLLSQRVRQGEEVIALPHEKRLLASLLGMTPENLSRAFTRLAAQGVTVQGRRVRIDRPEALERLARPSPFIDNPAPAGSGPLSRAERERRIWA